MFLSNISNATHSRKAFFPKCRLRGVVKYLSRLNPKNLIKGNKMRFNISMQSDKMGEGHCDKDFSETILLAMNGMVSGCDIRITKVKESVEEKSTE